MEIKINLDSEGWMQTNCSVPVDSDNIDEYMFSLMNASLKAMYRSLDYNWATHEQIVQCAWDSAIEVMKYIIKTEWKELETEFSIVTHA